MANMSYCRFINTLEDLQDCADHMHDADLSEAEQDARRRLIELCTEIASWYDEDD